MKYHNQHADDENDSDSLHSFTAILSKGVTDLIVPREPLTTTDTNSTQVPTTSFHPISTLHPSLPTLPTSSTSSHNHPTPLPAPIPRTRPHPTRLLLASPTPSLIRRDSAISVSSTPKKKIDPPSFRKRPVGEGSGEITPVPSPSILTSLLLFEPNSTMLSGDSPPDVRDDICISSLSKLSSFPDLEDSDTEADDTTQAATTTPETLTAPPPQPTPTLCDPIWRLHFHRDRSLLTPALATRTSRSGRGTGYCAVEEDGGDYFGCKVRAW
ncbi:hypothetical protein HDV00_003983 [Rhizophlyctis rosea]|nr:hypothetical protein HDV00_003983 [Rhizophlyctis rosea]